MMRHVMFCVLFLGCLSLPLALAGCKGGAEKAPEAAAKVVPANPNPGVCITCGAKVDSDKALADAKCNCVYKEKTYVFCCDVCKAAFEKEPDKWIASPAAPKAAP